VFEGAAARVRVLGCNRSGLVTSRGDDDTDKCRRRMLAFKAIAMQL